MKAPYIEYDDQVVYPVLEDEGAMETDIKINELKLLTINFNCLGTPTFTTMTLHIHIPLYKSIDLTINKMCKKRTFLNNLKEQISSAEDNYGIFWIFMVCIMIFVLSYAVITFFNLCRGKQLDQAVPFGGSFIKLFASQSETTIETSEQGDDIIIRPTNNYIKTNVCFEKLL